MTNTKEIERLAKHDFVLMKKYKLKWLDSRTADIIDMVEQATRKATLKDFKEWVVKHKGYFCSLCEKRIIQDLEAKIKEVQK